MMEMYGKMMQNDCWNMEKLELNLKERWERDGNDWKLQSECNKNAIWTADQKILCIVWCRTA